MYFINNSGHLFELPEYTKEPIGYEYDETPYIFWFENNDQSNLSINNYYIKIINLVYPINDINNFDTKRISDLLDIEIKLDSQIYSLIPAGFFQKAISEQKSIFEYYDKYAQYGNYSFLNKKDENDNYQEYQNIQVLKSDSKDNPEDEEIIILKTSEETGENFIIIPIYVIGYCKEVGTFISNILVHISHKYTIQEIWCPISVGGTFLEQYEELTIHGKNMGVDLPKDILRAVWGTSYYNDVFDESLYNKKLKEYMLNYMDIKGEIGNYNSAIKSLKWFGYYDRLQIYQLIQTDNEFKTQFVRDYFDIHTDLIQAYYLFVNNSLISLNYKIYEECKDENGNIILDKQYLNNDTLWGEGNPLLRNTLADTKFVHTPELLGWQQFDYLDTCIPYLLNELLCKISCLAYYYQKYFLPIFLVLKSWSVEDKVYENHKKLLTYAEDHYYEDTIRVNDSNIQVIFDNEHIRYFTHQIHFVDENFNEFIDSEFNPELTDFSDKTVYEKYHRYLINDSCINIPITFRVFDNNNEELKQNNYFNCLLFIKDVDLDLIIYNSKFSFIQTYKEEIDEETGESVYTFDHQYNAFILYPKLLNHIYNKKILTFINRKYCLYLNVNNTYFSYEFIIKSPEFDVQLGTLEYKYWCSGINTLHNIYKQYNKKYHIEDREICSNINSICDNYQNETNPKVIFKFIEDNVSLDITEYIHNYDWFDEPSKYLSNFPQIDDITDDTIYFNSYMHHIDFVNLNDISFGEKMIKNADTQEIVNLNKLIKNHREEINIHNNDKYLNIVHLYQLYQTKVDEQNPIDLDVLMFKKNLSVLCENVLFKNRPDDKTNNLFTITLLPTNSAINISTEGTDYISDSSNNISNDINEYFLFNSADIFDGNTTNLLNEKTVYYFILQKDIYGKIVTDDNNNVYNVDNIYSLIEDKSNKHTIGTLFYKLQFENVSINITDDNLSLLPEGTSLSDLININLDFGENNDTSLYTINSEYKLLNLSYSNNKFLYNYNNYTYICRYNIKIYRIIKNLQDENEYEEYTGELNLSNLSEEEIKNLNIYIGLNLYFYENKKILNYSGYYNTKYCKNLNLETNTCDIVLNNIEYKNVQLHPSQYLEYDDELTGITITSQNPSLYWHTEETLLDDIQLNNYDLAQLQDTNELEFSYGENISGNTIITDINDWEPTQIKYINYLCKNLTGLIGKYQLLLESETLDIILCLKIYNNSTDEPIEITSTQNEPSDTITLTGKESKVLLYFKVNASIQEELVEYTVSPHLYKLNYGYSLIEFNPDNDNNQDIINLYKHFFTKKYQIDYKYTDEDNIEHIENIKNIWDSQVQYNQDKTYDTYLMHGPITPPPYNDDNPYKEYWYIVFISKYTADYYNIDELYNIYNKKIDHVVMDIDPTTEEPTKYEYQLQYIKSNKLFLINRMNINYKENVNHFNKNELIVCSLNNNKMLPANIELSSKWEIKPLSWASDKLPNIYGNSNISIISIQPNNNEYARGYYELTVQYVLDQNLLNYRKIKKKLLIK